MALLRNHESRVVWFTSAGFLFLWLDLSLGHVSAGLKHVGMWLPLLFLPCAAAVSALTAVRPTAVTRRLFRLACYGAIAIGLLGFGFHLARFWKELKGTVQWEVLMRLMRYPPLFAPLAVAGVGILGWLVGDTGGGQGDDRDA